MNSITIRMFYSLKAPCQVRRSICQSLYNMLELIKDHLSIFAFIHHQTPLSLPLLVLIRCWKHVMSRLIISPWPATLDRIRRTYLLWCLCDDKISEDVWISGGKDERRGWEVMWVFVVKEITGVMFPYYICRVDSSGPTSSYERTCVMLKPFSKIKTCRPAELFSDFYLLLFHFITRVSDETLTRTGFEAFSTLQQSFHSDQSNIFTSCINFWAVGIDFFFLSWFSNPVQDGHLC